MNDDNTLEFTVLGQSVRFRTDGNNEGSAEPAVEYVKKVSQELQNKLSISDLNQLAVLTALKIAQDKINLEGDYKKDISDLQSTAKDALDMIEEVVPLQ